MALSGHLDASSRMSAFGGDLNGSTQHSIMKGKDGVFGNASRLFSRLYGIRENRALGSLAAGRVAESDWASVWEAIIVNLFSAGVNLGKTAANRPSKLASRRYHSARKSAERAGRLA